MLDNDNFHVEILSHESMIVIYCNGKSLSTRCYQFRNGEIGLFANCAKAVFKNIIIKTNPK